MEEKRIGGCGAELRVGQRVAFKCYSWTHVGYIHSFTPQKVRMVLNKDDLDKKRAPYIQYDADVYVLMDPQVQKERDELKDFVENRMEKILNG